MLVGKGKVDGSGVGVDVASCTDQSNFENEKSDQEVYDSCLIPHICIDAYSNTHFLTLDYSTTFNLLLHKNKITLLIVQKVFNPKTLFGTNIWKDGTFSFAMVISDI